MKKLPLYTFLLISSILFPLLAQAQSTMGTVRAFSVIGDVTLRNNTTGAEVSLTTGREFTEGFTVITGEASSVVLVQSNGATLAIDPETSLTVAEFLQDPYDTSQGTYTRLEEDPSTSSTRVRVNYGEVTGDVKRLRPSSSYNVDLPTGSAGIRGTRFNVVVNINFDSGEIFVTFTTAEGLVAFEYEGNVADIPGGDQVEIEGTVEEGSTRENVRVLEFTVGAPKSAPESKLQNVLQKVRRALQNASEEQDDEDTSDDTSDSGDESEEEEEEEAEEEEETENTSEELEETESDADETPEGDDQNVVDEFSPAEGPSGNVNTNET